MTNQVIPAEAVRAAHAAICEQNLDDCLDPDWRGKCVKALEAAAPYILSSAFKNAADQLEYGNPISGWLYDLADEYMLNNEGEK